MGCINSKSVMTLRSVSIREDYLKPHGFNSAAVAWEDLLTSRGSSGNDQLYAFVRSANSKNRSSATALDLIQDVKVETDVQSVPDVINDPEFGRLSRSKSCQSLEPDENKFNQGDSNLIGSRSFHTVEEYDALLERIHKSGPTSRESFESYLSSVSFKDENSLKTQRSRTEEEAGVESTSVVEYERSSSLRDLEQKGHEKGSKRKAMAKGLKSLDVSPIEFPAVARLKQWIHVEGKVYSPGTYVTPKFGTYNGKVPRPERQGGSSIFSPELVAAFEDCMHQLQEEEESILSIIDGYTPVDEVDDIVAEPSLVQNQSTSG